AEDDRDGARPAFRARGVPRPVPVVEDGDLVDLELHRHDWRASLDGDEAGAGLERLRRATDGELALGIGEDRELPIESRAQELEAAADRTLGRGGERGCQDGACEPGQPIPDTLVRGRRDGGLSTATQTERHD